MEHTIWNNVRFLTLDGPKFNEVIWRALRADVHKLNEQFYSKTFSKIYDESYYFSKFRSDQGLLISNREMNGTSQNNSGQNSIEKSQLNIVKTLQVRMGYMWSE